VIKELEKEKKIKLRKEEDLYKKSLMNLKEMEVREKDKIQNEILIKKNFINNKINKELNEGKKEIMNIKNEYKSKKYDLKGLKLKLKGEGVKDKRKEKIMKKIDKLEGEQKNKTQKISNIDNKITFLLRSKKEDEKELDKLKNKKNKIEIKFKTLSSNEEKELSKKKDDIKEKYDPNIKINKKDILNIKKRMKNSETILRRYNFWNIKKKRPKTKEEIKGERPGSSKKPK
jgi:hypothetical protein